MPDADKPPCAVIAVVFLLMHAKDADKLPVVVKTVFPVQHWVTGRVAQQLPGGTVERVLLINAGGVAVIVPGFVLPQPVLSRLLLLLSCKAMHHIYLQWQIRSKKIYLTK